MMSNVTPAGAYVPQWARPNNPTNAMSELAMRQHYKDREAAHAAEFALRPGNGLPEDLRDVWRALWIDAMDRKTSAADRRLIDSLRDAAGWYYAGRPYVVPAAEYLSAPKRKRAPARAVCCPHCGKSVAA